MDSSHTSLPNVDRANSTLFKRYLDEQHKSVIKSNNYPQLSLPMNSTIQITHRQQQDTYISKVNNNQTVLVKQKYSNGRKPSGDISKQRSSHTSRFMKRFQRQHKTNETITNVQKRDGKPRFEFHDSTTRVDQETQCTCLVSSSRNRGGEEHQQHHHHCPAKRSEVPHLSLNDRFHATSQHRRQPIQAKLVAPPPPPSSSPPPKHSRSPLPMLPPITTESISNLTYPVEQNPLPSPSIDPSTILHSESETLILDPPTINLSNEYYPLINDFLQDLSIEMNDKISVDIILEIEESLAQRIYDCIVGQDDENENDTKSYSTTTNDSSALSVPPPPPTTAPIINNNIISNESNDLPPISPISTTTQEIVDHQEKYFQPIREQPSTSFNNLLDRNRHSTPFNPFTKKMQNDTRSPFTESLFEPVNLLRTVNNNNNNDDFHFIPPSFSFDNQQLKSELSTISYQSSFSFLNHLLPPQATPIEKNPSAFKPIEPASTRTTTPFVLQRPQVQKTSTGVNWFGQS